MAVAKNLDFNQPDNLDEEDEATFAAIERGMKAASEGRVLPAEEVRKRMEEWLTKSSIWKTP
jgi:predicted transcriptional regulator